MSASWNPAFRPNAEAAPIVESNNIAPPATQAPQQLSSEPSFEVVDEEQASSEQVDAWFSQDGDEGGAEHWLHDDPAPNSEEVAPESEPAVVREPEPPSTANKAASPEPAPVTEEPSSIPTKHASSVSFARTVSHEVNWDESEDAEWNRSRSETSNPFQFMPPSDRSNSFPPVPPQQAGPVSDDHALPSTQAQDLMEEAEKDGYDAEDHGEAVFGGDIRGTDEEASAARFEEGLPLIPHSENQPETLEQSKPASSAGDAFAADEDDFFSQIQQSAGAQAEEPAPGLDRKSTMQVMGGGNTPALSREETLETMPEETEEAAKEDPQEAQADAGREEPAVADEDELAAKWGEAFGDDMDDDFLLGDSAKAKEQSEEIDPAAFFGSDDEGFLDDVDEAQAAPTPTPQVVPQTTAAAPAAQNRYAPQAAAPAIGHAPVNPYTPQAPGFQAQPAPPIQPSYGYGAPGVQASLYGLPQQQQQQQQRPELPKAQSFADKSKGGYHSPYDLPMEVVKPRKRQSMQHIARDTSSPALGVAAPPRSSSMYAQGPLPGPPPMGSRPGSKDGPPSPAEHKPPPPGPPKHKESFFEDLPMVAKPRPRSRHGTPQHIPPHGPPSAPPLNMQAPPAMQTPPMGGAMFAPPAPSPYAPAPTQGPASMVRSGSGGAPNPYAPPPTGPVPQMTRPVSSRAYAPMPQSSAPQLAPLGSGGVPNLVAPEKVNPFAPMPSGMPQMSQSNSASVPNLVSPEKVNPYAPMPGSNRSAPPASASVNRYSPAPPQPPAHSASTMSLPNGAPPPASSTRYSPAPGAGSRPPSSGYGNPPQSILPHQPRTSSPLAHFETHAHSANGDVVHNDRRSSSHYESKMSRVTSLPPTREVEEENEQAPPSSSHSTASHQLPAAMRHTPPPLAQMHSTLSPPKRSPYAPQAAAQGFQAREQEFAPPPRSNTQSPGSLYGSLNGARADPVVRPSSVHSPTSPTSTKMTSSMHMLPQRRRAPSMNLNLVPPTDGREHDPLQRWKGAPIVTWGVGGTMVMTFPKDVPRYGIGQTAPLIHRTPGEVKVKHVRDIEPLDEKLARFPGPLKGKGKKKETIAWLSASIEALERSAPDLRHSSMPSLEEKRAVERVLLWKILRVFIEYDGALEGSPAVVKAVRDILAPGLDGDETTGLAPYGGAAAADTLQTGVPKMQADSVDPGAIEQLRKHLMIGDREKAVWEAVDKRLWGHAMLIANTVSAELYKQVAQEFVRKEVNYPGHNNESIAALYKVLSGNFEDCVDELVPSHARAGLQLVSMTSAGEAGKDALEGLDKWRETLCLILGNRSPDDMRALLALGELLAGYGRAEAAHICFIFGRHMAVFGGLDDARSNFVLVGADHRRQGDQFSKETEAQLLSEVYEYGLSLAGGNSAAAPHLAAYKLHLAMTLAEYGHRDKAIQYCDGILNSISAQTKRSPYHHPILEQTVEDLVKRLKQAPREESSSWIPKPSMNKVSDSVWNRFNKFVAGEEHDGSGAGSPKEGAAESGPFARVAGGTPTISPSPSVTNFSDVYANNNSGYPLGQPPAPMALPGAAPVPQPTARSASRYAPAATTTPQPTGQPTPYDPSSGYAPAASQPTGQPGPYDPSSGYSPAPSRPSMERKSGDLQRSPYEPAQVPGMPHQYTPSSSNNLQPGYPGQSPGYVVSRESSYSGQPKTEQSSYQPTVPTPQPGYLPQPSQNNPYSPTASTSGYNAQPAQDSPYTPSAEPNPVTKEEAISPQSYGQGYNQGYQPSFGYEPPSTTHAEDEFAQSSPTKETAEQAASEGYQVPSYQPYGYEPPTYNPDMENDNDEGDQPKPKKKTIFDDDDDDIPGVKAMNPNNDQNKSKTEKDKENEEMFRKIAEEEAKRDAEKKAAKKGWGFGGWFGGKKEAAQDLHGSPNKPIKAKLGEESSFVYDPDLKRWVNKKAGAENTEAKKATPPPPRSMPRSANSTPPPPSAGMPPPGTGRSSAPPGGPPRSVSGLVPESSLSPPKPPSGLGNPDVGTPMARSVSHTSATSGPPSRPTTSMSNASSIDDLLSTAGPRKPGGKKAKKGGSRYVDVMAK